MANKVMSKADRMRRKNRPPYPKTRRVSFMDVITSRDLWIAVYLFFMFQLSMLLISISSTAEKPLYWVYGGAVIAIVTAIHGLYMAKKRQDSKFRAKLVSFGQVIGVIALLFMTIFTISTLFSVFDLPISEQTNQTSLNNLLDQNFLVMAFVVTIVAPIIEELVFREYLPHAGGPSYASFFISSLLFLMLHSPAGLIGWLLYCSMSVAFMYLRLKGNNIFSSIYGHVLYNTLTIVLSFI